MDPPTPVKDQLKKVWNNPKQGAGLLGLAAKKIGGGMKNALFGSMASSTIQQQSIQINFQDEYSMNNMENIAPKVQKTTNKKNIVITEILKELQVNGLTTSNLNCQFDGKDRYYIKILNNDKKEVLKFIIVME